MDTKGKSFCFGKKTFMKKDPVLSGGCAGRSVRRLQCRHGPNPGVIKPAAQDPDCRCPGFASKQLGREPLLQARQADGALYVLNFWATWCPPCRAELPEIAAFASAHAKDVRFYGIDLDEPEGMKPSWRSKPSSRCCWTWAARWPSSTGSGGFPPR